MLSIGKMVAGAEDYYLRTVAAGREEYYTGAGESPGEWLGKGAAELGLVGEVAPEHLRAVLAGTAPDGQVLTAGRVDPNRRVSGFDLTWSAPKSVSLLYGLGDPATATAVRRVHSGAVADALGYLEDHGLAVRRGAGGERRVGATGVVAAAFSHRTSRAGDPQLHTHVLVANVAHGHDGAWSAPDARLLYFHARTAGFVYQAVLRAGLTDALGVRFGPVRHGMAELADVAPGLLRAFSSRRAAIEAHLAVSGATSVRAAEVAALVTRSPKDRGKPAAPGATDLGLRERWRAQVAALGPEIVGDADPSLGDVLGAHRRWVPTEPEVDELVADLVGPGGLTHSVSTFEHRDVVRVLAAAMPDGARAAELDKLAERVLESAPLVRLPGLGRGGEQLHTTAELLAVEAALLDRSVARRTEGAALVAEHDVERALVRFPFLATEQRAMARRLTTSGTGVEVVVGRAGTGKTTALAAARVAWEAAGYRLHGAALSARAAKGLDEGAGIASSTLSRLLQRLDAGAVELTRRDVVVVDEAGMVGTRTLARLLDRAQVAGAKVVVVGDPRQLPEIEAGGAFAHLARRLGTTELAENRRQHDPWERAALDQLRHGVVDWGIAAFADHGRVHEAKTVAEARRQLVAAWLLARRSGAETAMLAVTRADVAALNEAARSALREQGLLGPDVVHVGDMGLALGDEVVCLRNDARLKVLNGTRGWLRAVESESLVLATDGGSRHVPLDYALDHLAHGYALTVHKAQGATVERAFVLATHALTREAGYVALSRARHGTDLFVPVGAFEDGVDHHAEPRRVEGPAPSHLEPLARRLSVSLAKETATEALDRAPGLPVPEPPTASTHPEDAPDEVPHYIASSMGVRPMFVDEAREYDRVARAVTSYRARYSVSDDDALGPPPLEASRRLAYESAAADLHSYQRRLGRSRELEPLSLGRGR